MRGTIRTLFGVAAATALAVTLTACDDDSGDVAAGPDPIVETPPTEAPDDQPAPPADPGEVTPPGTELSIGETAVVPYRDALIAITVTAVDEGDRAAFQTEYDADDNLVPYYIWITAENVSDEDVSNASLPIMKGIQADGRSTGVVLFGRSLGECQRESFPSGSGAGATVDSCSLEAAPTGVEIAGIQYEESDGGYRDDPITWWR